MVSAPIEASPTNEVAVPDIANEPVNSVSTMMLRRVLGESGVKNPA
jgi:hypothetical protein